MSKRSIDTSTAFSNIDYEQQSPEKKIEDPEIHPIPKENPFTIIVFKEPYLADLQLQESVDLAIALGRPLLLQGEPGCGKTSLAYAVAYALGLLTSCTNT